MEYYVHHLSGRMRVRIPAIRKDPRYASEIRDMLNIYGVDNITVNHLSGSVVVIFDTGLLSREQLFALLRGRGCRHCSPTGTFDGKLQRAPAMSATKVGRAMISYAVGKALEASGLSLLAALI